MSVTSEELAAYADGELDPARREEVRAKVEADPALAAQVAAHAALKQKLAAHFAPIMEAPVPDRLTELLRTRESAPVADFAAAREKRDARRALSGVRWRWVAGPALAASLALAVFLPRGGDVPEGYAGEQLASALEQQLVSSQSAEADTRILLSFRNDDGQFCRAFAGAAQSGIACRDGEGWRLHTTGAGASAQQRDYRMAGADAGSVLAQAQELAAGPALTAEEEAAAREQGWR
jgi:hypothetical protein